MKSIDTDKVLNRIHSELAKNNGSKNLNKGLMAGDLSQILFYFYFNKYYKIDSTIEIEKILENNFTNINDKFYGMSLSVGLSGLSFIANFLIKNKMIDENDIDLELINSEIVSFSSTELIKSNYDYLHGGLGGIMHLNNYNDVDNFIELIYNNKVQINKNEITLYNLSDSGIKERSSNLGLAHGLSSLVIVLSNLFEKTSKKNMCLELVSGLLTFILKQKRHNKLSLYPNIANNSNENDAGGRLAWCNGDLGIASAFWQAGKIFNNESWKDEAIDIMVFNSKRRGLAMNGLSDACFCHGTSGIAHIFNRFYLETKVPDFNSARQYWINETIKKADFENTECVFKTWESSDMRFQNDFGLLNGITGVGLTLLGFLSDNIEDLSWDKSLLLS
jgi:hypothetical protein